VATVSLHDGRHDGTPAIDSINLPADARAAFRPPRPAVGTRWELPGPVARSFTPALSPLTDSLYTPRPGDLTAAALRGEVEAVSGARVLIRLSGRWTSAHDRDGGTKSPVRCTATADGLAEYDTATGRMRSLLLVFQGTFQTAPPGRARATGAVVEWRAAESAPR
jgi:hypothetical protein